MKKIFYLNSAPFSRGCLLQSQRSNTETEIKYYGFNRSGSIDEAKQIF